MEFVYLVKIYDSTGRLLPVVTAFATRQGAEAYVHDFCKRINSHLLQQPKIFSVATML